MNGVEFGPSTFSLQPAMKQFEFATDTATMCVYDIGALKHRLNDTADWWSLPSEELAEVNNGNAAFINLQSDGKYSVKFDENLEAVGALACNL